MVTNKYIYIYIYIITTTLRKESQKKKLKIFSSKIDQTSIYKKIKK